MKLQGKILLAFLLAGLPLVAIDALWLARNYRSERGRASGRLRGEAESAADIVQVFLRDLAARGEQMARRIPREEDLPGYLRGRLADLRRGNAGITALAWLDAEGRFGAGEPAELSRHAASLADRAAFQALRGGQTWVLDELVIEEMEGRPLPLLWILARDVNGMFKGAVGIGLEPETFRPLLAQRRRWAEIRLADRAGRLVYATDLAAPSLAERQRWADVPGVGAALHGRAATNPEVLLGGARQGKEWMAAHIPIPQLGWVASALFPAAEATRAVRETLYKELAAHGLLVALCVAAALILAHHVATPARRLADAAYRIAVGERAARVGLTGSDELAAVGRAFDEMATALDASWRDVTAQRDAARDMAGRLAMLGQLAGLVSTSLDPGQVFEFVTAATSRLLDGAAAFLFVADAGGEGVAMCSSHGARHPELRVQNRFRAGEGLPGIVFQTKEPIVLDNVLQDPRAMNRAWLEVEGLRAFVGVPMLSRDRCLGVLFAARGGARVFRQAEVDLLASFAAHAATAVQNARLHEGARAEMERLRAFLEAMPEAVSIGEGEMGQGNIRLVMGNRVRAELLRTSALVEGARTPYYEFVHPDGTPLDEGELPLQRAIWRGEATRGAELAVRFPDGSQRFLLASGAPLPEAGGMRRAVAVFQDITARKRAEDELKRLAEEVVALYERAAGEAQVKGLLLDELNHRVRNTLGLIASFLEIELESAAGRDARPLLEDAIARVEGLAVVHNALAEVGVEAAHYGPLVRRLAEQTLLQGSLAGRVAFRAEGVPLRLPSAHLTALGLITNELFTNITRHAFPAGRTGNVKVMVVAAGGEATVRVEDDGVGLPTGFAQQPGHLGLQLIRSLAEVSLKGTFALESHEGTTAVIRFPLPELPASRTGREPGPMPSGGDIGHGPVGSTGAVTH